MYFAREIVFAALVLIFATKCKSDRIFFSSCGVGGFTCVNENQKHNLTFNCNAQTKQDVTLYVWQFRSPNTIANLKIQNCVNVTLYTTCTTEQKIVKTIWLLNITNLIIMPSPVNLSPQIFIFENIERVSTIPRETFSQALKKTYRPACTPVGIELQQIIFKNVNVGVVETHAFYNVSGVEVFTWDNVSIDIMQTGALKIELKKGAEMAIRKSRIDVLEHLSFQITGENVSFVGNRFVDVQASGINGTILNFNFYNNTVENFQGNGFTLLSQNVYILDNRFDYLQSGALQKISPGLLFDSNTNFGKLQFVYEFIGNVIYYVDVGGLHPDTVAYSNVAARVSFARNALFCSCEKLGWISMKIGLGHSQAGMNDFYVSALDDSNKNICRFSSCTLPLKSITKIYDKCLDGIIFKDYCEDTEKPKVIKIEYDVRNGSTEELFEIFASHAVTYTTFMQITYNILLINILSLLAY